MALAPIQPATFCSGTTRPKRPMHQSEVKFGMFADRMATVFQPITEQFVWQFLTNDVLALWLPRIGNALRRGRNVYDIKKETDPEVRDMSPQQQLLYHWYMNAKGLNYKNAFEETMREVETGPVIFAAPSVLIALATMLSPVFKMGKLALMMSRNDLHYFHGSFAHFLKEQSGPIVSEEKVLQDYVRKLLGKHFDEHAEHVIPANFYRGHEPDAPLTALLKRISPKRYNIISEVVAKHGKITDQFLADSLRNTHPDRVPIKFAEVLDKWTHDWAHLKAPKWSWKKPFHSFKSRMNYNFRVDEYRASLDRIVFWYNDCVTRMGQDSSKLTWVNLKTPVELGLKSEILKPSGKHTGMHAGVLYENLRKFRTFVHEALHLEGNANRLANGNLLAADVLPVAEGIFKRVIKGKLFYSILATGLASFCVISVSAIAQRSKIYPANRNIIIPPKPPVGQKSSAYPQTAKAAFAGLHAPNPWHNPSFGDASS